MLHLGKRINPAPPASADLTDHPARRVLGFRPQGKIGRRRGFERLAEPEAPSDSHREKAEGKIDLSREPLSAGDIRVGAGDGRDALPGPDFADSGDWPRGAEDGGIYPGNGDGNNAGRGHSEGRDKTPRHREESDTRADEKQRNKQPAPVSREGTGQPATIMAG